MAARSCAPPRLRQPVALQTLNWLCRPMGFLSRCQQRYGDVFEIEVAGWARLALIADPRLVEEVLRADGLELKTGAANELMRPLVGDQSIFLMDGPRHRALRRDLMSSFARPQVQARRAFIAEVAEAVMTPLADGRPRSIHDALRRIAMAVALDAVFGVRDGAQVERYADALAWTLGGTAAALAYLRPLQADLGRFSPGGWLRHRVREVDDLLHAEIWRRWRRHEPGPGALGQLMATRMTPDAATLALLRDVSLSLIVAGHDTVATAAAWMLHWVAVTPGLIDRVRGAALTEDAGGAAFLDAVCAEALRLVPPVEIVSRVAERPFRLGPYDIDAGVLVSPSPYLVHRNAALYPEPARFDPERFLGRKFAAHEYLPFGGGIRRCIGAALGQAQMREILVAATLSYDLREVEPAVWPVRRNVTIAPSGGPRLVLTPRPRPALRVAA